MAAATGRHDAGSASCRCGIVWCSMMKTGTLAELLLGILGISDVNPWNMIE